VNESCARKEVVVKSNTYFIMVTLHTFMHENTEDITVNLPLY